MAKVVDAAIEGHCTLGGPGLLDEEALACELESRGLTVVRQEEVPLVHKGERLASDLLFDLLVGDQVIVERQAAAAYNRVFEAQALTCLRGLCAPRRCSDPARSAAARVDGALSGGARQPSSILVALLPGLDVLFMAAAGLCLPASVVAPGSILQFSPAAVPVRRPVGARLGALAADLGHVLAVLAHDLAALAASHARLLRRELVRGALLVRCPPALAGDPSLKLLVHRREPTLVLTVTSHGLLLIGLHHGRHVYERDLRGAPAAPQTVPTSCAPLLVATQVPCMENLDIDRVFAGKWTLGRRAPR